MLWNISIFINYRQYRESLEKPTDMNEDRDILNFCNADNLNSMVLLIIININVRFKDGPKQYQFSWNALSVTSVVWISNGSIIHNKNNFDYMLQLPCICTLQISLQRLLILARRNTVYRTALLRRIYIWRPLLSLVKMQMAEVLWK